MTANGGISCSCMPFVYAASAKRDQLVSIPICHAVNDGGEGDIEAHFTALFAQQQQQQQQQYHVLMIEASVLQIMTHFYGIVTARADVMMITEVMKKARMVGRYR
jgi:hypothetical protein